MANNEIYVRERRLLQICIFAGSCVPVVGGGAGMILGASLFAGGPDVSLDSHMRYLSGLLFAIGIGFWTAVPKIEAKTSAVRLLTFLVVTGGIARLAGLMSSGVPSGGMLFALVMELVAAPALCLWQGRIARLSAHGGKR